MQDEVNEKIIALCVQTTRMSTGVLKASMRKFLDGMSRQKQKRVQVKQAVKTGKAQEKGREKERKRQEMKKPHGKQTIKQTDRTQERSLRISMITIKISSL